MNADNIPIANQEKLLNKEDYSKSANKVDQSPQNGNYGINEMKEGQIKGNAKVAGRIDENHTIHNYPQNKPTIKGTYKNQHEEFKLEFPHTEENYQRLLNSLKEIAKDSELRYKNIEKSSIKFTIEGSEEGLNRIVNSYNSGELAPLLREQFNLELENAQLIDSESSENFQKNRSQKLLAFIIAGDVDRDCIDTLKAALIDTSDDDEEIKNEGKSRLTEEIRTKGTVKRNISIPEIVEQVLQNGYLTPSMKAEVESIFDRASELNVDEYVALDRLMSSLLTGEVITVKRKQFINVMEELVLSEAISRIAEIEPTSEITLEVEGVAAYALNRLPPLYATTEEGANYQRKRANEELRTLVQEQVIEAIVRYIDRPNFYPKRQALGKISSNNLTKQLSSKLKSYASNFEAKS